MRILASAALVLLLGAFVVKLAVAPLFERYSAVECHAAYARAHTRADTARLDLHPYAPPDGRGRHVCGEVRARVVDTPSDVSALPQPNEDL